MLSERMNILFVVFLACLSFVSSGNEIVQGNFKWDEKKSVPSELKSPWNSFKLEHEKTYFAPGEEEYRRLVYQQNSQAIAEWNERFKLGQVSFMMGENEYSDLADEEFEHMKNLKLPSKILQEAVGELNDNGTTGNENIFEAIAARHLPLNCTMDLRNDTCLVPVKNQKKCGSCYAFPATCLIEFAFCKRKNLKTAISFSEQQCVDCSRRFGNYGCNGGYYEGCFNYWKTRKITSAATYPYTAKAARCKQFGSTGYVNVGAYTTLTRWDEVVVETVLCTFKQPIAVAIHATKLFDSYKSGVFTDPTCANFLKNKRTKVNHAVTIVGIGTDPNGTKYWTVRNSWGPTWGENGYMKIKRGDNTCNIGINPCMVHL